MPTGETPGNGGTVTYRVGQVEADVRELRQEIRAQLSSIEAKVQELVLHQARMEPFERMLWIVVGVVMSAVGAGLLWAMAKAASASGTH